MNGPCSPYIMRVPMCYRMPQYLSWKRAVTTGNWGSTPEKQKAWVSNRTLHPNVATAEANAKYSSFESFVRTQAAWFAMARRVCADLGLPILHLATEDVWEKTDSVRARLVSFLHGASQ